MSWMYDFDRLSRLAATFDRSIKLYTKDNWFMRLCALLLFIISFGRFKQETFLKDYATTLAHAHFYPKEWNIPTVERVLVHEAEHTRQFKMLGLWTHPLAGIPAFTLLYLISPLPMFLCWGRLWAEVGANKAFWRYALKHLGWTPAAVYNNAEHKALQISSAAYLWAWPLSWAKKAYKKAADEVIDDWKTR